MQGDVADCEMLLLKRRAGPKQDSLVNASAGQSFGSHRMRHIGLDP